MQVIRGHIGVVVRDLDSLKERLASVEEPLLNTKLGWSTTPEHVAVTCPWGNRFRCYAANEKFGDMALGIPYVEFQVEPGHATGIARFYDRVLAAPTTSETDGQGAVARVKIGRNQTLLFRETDEPLATYDGPSHRDLRGELFPALRFPQGTRPGYRRRAQSSISLQGRRRPGEQS